jgi:baseplate J-like protein
MTRPDERRFVLFDRGYVRDQIILSHMRNSLRGLTNPDTNALFTEDEITRLVQSGSRYYIQADAVDLYGQAVQSRDSYFVDQVVPGRAASPFLLNVHGPLWAPEGLLTATGGTGTVTALSVAGVIWTGSTTIGDPVAVWGRDPLGKRYQVLTTTVADSSGNADLRMLAIDGGDETNIAVGTIITWNNAPVGAQPEAVVAIAFTGGVDDETENDYAKRIEDRIRRRPASGNQAHFRAWARQSTNSVENAYVYACALNAGSVVAAVTQKRANVVGPNARIPNFTTLATVSAYLTPPNSPVVPGGVYVLVVPTVAQPTDVGLRLGLRRGTPGGWADATPWPKASPTYPRCTITALSSQTSFTVTTDVAPLYALPVSGSSCPQLMVWRKATSGFEKLSVANVSSPSANQYTITLAAPISTSDLAIGDVLSPYTDRLAVAASAVQTHFDSLGPGEVINLATDLRAHRAYRYPRTSEEAPSKLTQSIVTTLIEVLGGTISFAELVQASLTAAPVPTSIASGPSLLTAGNIGIYDPDD